MLSVDFAGFLQMTAIEMEPIRTSTVAPTIAITRGKPEPCTTTSGCNVGGDTGRGGELSRIGDEGGCDGVGKGGGHDNIGYKGGMLGSASAHKLGL